MDQLPNIPRPGHEPYEHPSDVSYPCESCGKTYLSPHHIATHVQTCGSNKRKVGQMLQASKAFWEARKKRKVEGRIATQREQPDVEKQPRLEELAARQASPIPFTPTAVEGVTEHSTIQNLNAPNSTVTPSESVHGGRGGTELLLEMTVSGPTKPVTDPADDLNLPVAQRKGKRERRRPKRFRQDDLPAAHPRVRRKASSERQVQVANEEEAPTVAEASTTAAGTSSQGSTSQSPNRPLVLFQSDPDVFGVVRTYTLPSGDTLKHDPDRVITLQALSNIPKKTVRWEPTYGPFKTKSAFTLADWYWNSTNKSFLDFQKLIAILKQPDFSLGDTVSVNWRSAFKALGANQEDIDESEDSSWITDDGWTTTPINIDIPFHKQMKDNKGTTSSYCIGQLRHRRIVSVIKEKISNREDSRHFHYTPYRSTWNATDSESTEVELYGELYCSRAFRAAHEEVQRLPSTETNRGMERVVVALMFWSDATHLTTFGNAYLWPCYLLFGNESKYRRCQPTERLVNQIAYFRKLPDTFYDYLKGLNGGKIPYDGLLAYCVREAYHQQWSTLLDEELCDAMRHGICLRCPDGEIRCFYPRIFTYSGDYPEKVLLAGIRNNGLCPCHRCLVQKNDLSGLGTPRDVERDVPRQESEIVHLVNEAQQEIMEGHYAVDSTTKVEVILKPHSLVPSKNAFHNFAGHPFDIRRALVVDLMHEFEIGVWKRLFIHGIRLLEFYTTPTATLTAALDERYRATPAFGRDSIRKFGLNVSDMKRKAARDFADLLQCAIPTFESLLPEPLNTTLMELLYICAQWHALAKLRLHNDFTADFLDYTTKVLGSRMRHFAQEVCSKIPTKELSKEAEARARKEGNASGKGKTTRKPAKLAIFTIKFHFLGDYVSTIRWFGTTDSYSTETACSPFPPSLLGELAHRLPKSWYPRTDKREYEEQMSQIERRQARLGKIRSEVTTATSSNPPPVRKAPLEPPQTSQIEQRQARPGILKTRSKVVTVGSSNPPPTVRIEPPEASQISHVEQRPARPHSEVATATSSNPRPTGDAPLESSPDRRYVMARNQDSPVDVSVFSSTPGWDHEEDPYTKVIQLRVTRLGTLQLLRPPSLQNFLPKLKQHLLPRILEKLGHPVDSLSAAEYCNVTLGSGRIYKHRLLRINYTTYDVRRHEDVIHIDTPQCNIMLLNKEYKKETWRTEHPYLYGKCLGVFHANVSFVGYLPDGTRRYTEHRIDFVWVRWYDHLPERRPFMLDRVSLASLDSPGSVDFIDPADILRGVHIIPQFSLGEAEKQIRSKWVPSSEKEYEAYYINQFADRDLFMRYQFGMSVGHTYMHRGKFPPPMVPSLPDNFKYWDEKTEGEEEEEEEEEEESDSDLESEGGADSSALDFNPVCEMEDREMDFYLEMYDS